MFVSSPLIAGGTVPRFRRELAAQRAAWPSGLARGLATLLLPPLNERAGGTLDSPAYTVANLAEGANSQGGAGMGASIYRFGTAFSGGVPTPAEVRDDGYAPYWLQYDAEGTGSQFVLRLAAGGESAGIPWRPDLSGGYAAATAMVVYRVMRSTGGQIHTILHVGVPSGGTYLILRNFNTSFHWVLSCGGSVAQLAPAAPSAGALMLGIGTTRAVNDHEVMLYNVQTGTAGYTTASVNVGTSAAAPTAYALGGQVNASSPFITLPNQFSRVYAHALWTRGMTRTEMQQTAQFFTQIWMRPRLPRSLFGIASPPVVPVASARPRSRIMVTGWRHAA